MKYKSKEPKSKPRLSHLTGEGIKAPMGHKETTHHKGKK